MEYKVCYKCRKKLPLTSEYFAKQKKSADGYDGRCKPCVNLLSKKYRENKGEQYRVDNIYKAKEQQLNRLAKGQCRHCSSKRLENSDLYCEKHWFEYVSKAHLGTMKKGNELKKLLELQDYRCAYTGIKLIPALNASIDHKIPLSIDVDQYQKIENLQWVCLDINIMKRNHSEEDFLKYIKLIYENRFWVGTIQYTDGDGVRSSNTQLSVKSEAQPIAYGVGGSSLYASLKKVTIK